MLPNITVIVCVCMVVFVGIVSGNTLRLDAEACAPATRPRVLTDPRGSLVSANYPSNYPDSVDCQWLIRAQPGQVVNVDFTAFNTERRFDTIYFFDGDSTLAPAIFGLDGDRSNPPAGIRSSGGVMYIWFTSDASNNATGFSATYQSVPAIPASVISACLPGSRPLALSGSGAISTPYFANNYPLNCQCEWLIVSQEQNGFIRLDFSNFLTQPNTDWVVVYDGTSASSPILARLSGNYPQPPTGFKTTQRSMYIRFESSGNIVTRGFSATYTSVLS